MEPYTCELNRPFLGHLARALPSQPSLVVLNGLNHVPAQHSDGEHHVGLMSLTPMLYFPCHNFFWILRPNIALLRSSFAFTSVAETCWSNKIIQISIPRTNSVLQTRGSQPTPRNPLPPRTLFQVYPSPPTHPPPCRPQRIVAVARSAPSVPYRAV
jgi:hypothetical protein